MNCPKCKLPLEEGQTECPYCSALESLTGVSSDPKPSANQENTAPSVPKYTQNSAPHKPHAKPVPNYPMKWYYFLIYFSLIASAVMNFITAIGTFFGILTMLSMGIDEAFAPTLLTSVVSLIASLTLGVLSISARSALAKKKESGPKSLYSIYTTSIIFNCITAVISMFTLNITGVVGVIPGIIGNVVMLILNRMYFDKRFDLFVN